MYRVNAGGPSLGNYQMTMVNHHPRRQPLLQRQLPPRRQLHLHRVLCLWHVPQYQATRRPQALGATTSLVELSADHRQELAAPAITEADRKSLADVVARKEAKILLLLRRQPLLQRQLQSFQIGLVSTSKAAYATFVAMSLLWSSRNCVSCTSDGSMSKNPI